MKIITHGRITEKVLYGKCHHCGCEFIATKNECREFDETYGYTTDCPECTTLVALKYVCKNKVIPDYWRDN